MPFGFLIKSLNLLYKEAIVNNLSKCGAKSACFVFITYLNMLLALHLNTEVNLVKNSH